MANAAKAADKAAQSATNADTNKPTPPPENKTATPAGLPPSKTPPANKTTYMYLGPNLPGGDLFTGSLYCKEIPKYLEDKFKKLPELKKLFVEVKKAPQFKVALQTQGSAAHTLYRTAEQKIRKGALKDGV